MDIRDCLSSDLAGLNIYAEGALIDSHWPCDGDILSEKLIQKIAPNIATEQREIISQGATIQDIQNSEECLRTFIPVCKDRELIVMFLKKRCEQDFFNRVHNPNKIYDWGIPSVPICHVPTVGFDLAISECLHEHVTVIWQRTAEDVFQRIMEDTDAKLTWLSKPDDLYPKLVAPFLSMIQILHEHHVNHGDVTDDNVIMSEEMGRLFFIDFETLGSAPYIVEGDKAESVTNYYFWHMERLYDLAYLSYTITNLATKYIPNIKEDNCIIQYFIQLGADLEEICDEHDAYMTSDDDNFELDTDCINRHIHITIEGVANTVRQLHESRTEILKSIDSSSQASEMNTHEFNPKKLVRKFSIYCEANSADEVDAAMPLYKR